MYGHIKKPPFLRRINGESWVSIGPKLAAYCWMVHIRKHSMHDLGLSSKWNSWGQGLLAHPSRLKFPEANFIANSETETAQPHLSLWMHPMTSGIRWECKLFKINRIIVCRVASQWDLEVDHIPRDDFIGLWLKPLIALQPSSSYGFRCHPARETNQNVSAWHPTLDGYQENIRYYMLIWNSD